MIRTLFYYAQRLSPFAAVFLAVQFLLRCLLLWISYPQAGFADLAHIFALGLFFDIGVFCFFALLYVFYLTILPRRMHGGRVDRILSAGSLYAFICLILFGAIAEYFFWDEFTARFNFIAVDYLVYTQEVLGNIRQSYPVVPLFGAIFAAGLVLCAALLRYIKIRPFQPSLLKRYGALVIFFLVAGLFYNAADIGQTQWSDRQTANELSANGIYNLFYAYNNNELDYTNFYKTADDSAVRQRVTRLLEEPEAPFVDHDGELVRAFTYPGPELHKNVMLVVMESLSAEYMGSFGNEAGLTPNLDRLGREGLLFTNLYATGTRTVRGLEAVTLSVPPTPGQSILRRPHNENLFSLGYIFQDRGYDTRFVYGGYGYFDNMNYFFAHNGFDILDRAMMPEQDIHFANVWGVCDEDLFGQAMKAADQSFAAGKPFMNLIMTTSNHRPYTYPEGKIDIASPGGRAGGVKYADYAVGQFIEAAKQKPWFNNTVFVFVADHTAGAAGKTELSLNKYHIPLIFYAPGFVQPRQFTPIASQIDVAPILLGMLQFDYYSKFYGEDLLNDADEVPHAFISTYQKIAMIKEGEVIELLPNRKVNAFRNDASVEPSPSLVDDAVAYYQYAADWRQRMQRLPSTIVTQEAHAVPSANH